MIKGWVLAAAAAVMAIGGLARAADAVTPVEKNLMAKGVQVVQSFPSASGLKAIIADNGKEKRLFYVTPDGKSLIVGMVFDTAGENVTTADMSRAGVTDVGGPKTLTENELESIWSRAEKLSWIAEGTGKKTIYVLFDPNCPYCHRLWTSVRSAVASGAVQVRWLPVAILKDSSKGLAAGIYESKTPSRVLSDMVNRQLQPVAISDAANKKMAYNLLLLRDTGYTGVPTILYRQNGKVRTAMGSPTDAELAALLR
jgi:thiol:disulfide interchange protein DsbG